MNEFLMTALEHAAAAVSLLLMGACGVGLALRLLRVLRGQEAADGLTRRSAFAPGASLLAAAGVGLLSRLALYGLAYAMYRLLGVGNDGPLESLAPLWTHWDTRHYIGIAQEGYTAVGDERLRLVFFPLYPALMRLVSPLTGGNLFAAGLLVSLACSAAATALVYDLSYLHFGRRTARRSVAYFLLSPLSVFLCCAYTEALFICLTLAAVCLLRRGHPWLAALCGALSALTRMPGVIVAGLFIVETLGKIPQKRANARALLACAGQVLLVFSGLFVYWLINWLVTGDPLMYMTYQRENWFQEPGTFWGSVSNTVYYLLGSLEEGDWFFSWGAQLAAMAFIFLLLVFRSDALPFDWAAYSFVYVAVVLAPTWLLSGPRYLFALAPLPMLKAQMVRGRGNHAAALTLSAALLVLFTFGYTI
ncbi:MAG: mannosyltransferase family protein, partial [Candidatus Ventricola sp.]|nr:mannosyltransferase family protein [Candidatus Ventricola sp.]